MLRNIKCVIPTVISWPWDTRYQVSRKKPNPWRHGGRRGVKRKPTLDEFRFVQNVREYRNLCREGWNTCYPRGHWLRETWLRLVTP